LYSWYSLGFWTLSIWNKSLFNIRKSRRNIFFSILSCNDLIAFMVGQSHGSFTLLGVKTVNVMSFSGLSSTVHDLHIYGTLKQTRVSSNMFLCPWVTKSAEILDYCLSQHCRSVMTLSVGSKREVNP
jgi:hypothetical protein